MTSPERPNAQPIKLSPSLLDRLNVYALAATAAGLGILAAAPAAEAKVVYTPAHVVIPGGGYFLDLNQDGINDFNLNINGNSRGRSDSGYFSIQPVDSANLIWGHGEIKFGFRPRVAAFDLPAGFQVGPGNEAAQPLGSKLLAGYYRLGTTGGISAKGTGGDWAKGVNGRYLGFAFSINGETHFGWARLTVTMSPNRAVHALLTGYAYETVANRAITTGQTSDDAKVPQASLAEPGPADQGKVASLGMLALGSTALQLWRRE